MRKPAIGILAGMGPRSTAPFVDMVVDECARQYGAKSDMDFPAMLIYSLPTPFYPDRPVDHDDLRGAIRSGLAELAGFGVDFTAMPCNIAHIYYDELASSIAIPLLNIVDETVASIPSGCRSAALFAARGTAEAGIYQRGIAKSGMTAVYLPEWQGRIDRLIASVKVEGASAGNIAEMAALLAGAEKAGAGCAVIACTDLTPLAINCKTGLGILNSARSLAKATVSRYIELRRKMET